MHAKSSKLSSNKTTIHNINPNVVSNLIKSMVKRRKTSKSLENKRFRRRLKSAEKKKNRRRNSQKSIVNPQQVNNGSKRTIAQVKSKKSRILNYEQKAKQFIKKGILGEGEVFHYQEDNNAEEYESTFQFYQKNLAGQSRYNIGNSCYYFADDNTINAAAIKKKHHNLIKINKGLMIHMINMFKNNPELLNHQDLAKYSEFEKITDVPNHILMYQNAAHFVFYHELGHLIQFNNINQKALKEDLINSGNFNFNKHLGEMDADEFAGVSMASHISQYFEKYKDVEGADRLLRNLLVLVLSSLILYILSFPSNRVPIYYKKGTHPHPVIRVLSVAFTITNHLKELLLKHNIEINLDHVEIFKEALSVSQIIETEQWGSALCTLFNDNVENNYDEIWAYIKEMQDERTNRKDMAIYKRNRIAKMIQGKKE